MKTRHGRFRRAAIVLTCCACVATLVSLGGFAAYAHVWHSSPVGQIQAADPNTDLSATSPDIQGSASDDGTSVVTSDTPGTPDWAATTSSQPIGVASNTATLALSGIATGTWHRSDEIMHTAVAVVGAEANATLVVRIHSGSCTDEDNIVDWLAPVFTNASGNGLTRTFITGVTTGFVQGRAVVVTFQGTRILCGTITKINSHGVGNSLTETTSVRLFATVNSLPEPGLG